MSAATLTPTKTVRAARQAAPKPGSLCVVEIGVHLTFAMPLEQGLKLVQLLDGAKPVEVDLDTIHRNRYYERTLIGETRLQIIPAKDLILLRPKPAPKESGVQP